MHVFKLLENFHGRVGQTLLAPRALEKPCLRGATA